MAAHVDRRDQFARALWDECDRRRRGEWDEAARRVMNTALVRVALHEDPLRSAAQARRVRSVGPEAVRVLEAATGPVATEPGKYASAAAAVLAALLELEKRAHPVPMRDLLTAAGALLESGRAFAPLTRLVEAPASCGAWSQIVPLEGALGYVKRRARKGLEGGLAFELTDEGRAAAERARRGTGGVDTGPLRQWGGTGGPDDVVAS